MVNLTREHVVIMAGAMLVMGFLFGRLTAPAGEPATTQAGTANPQKVAPAANTPASPAPVAKSTPAPAAKPKTTKPAPRRPVAAKKPTPRKPAPTKPSTAAVQTWKVTLNSDDPSKGPKNAPVTVVVMSAFGCKPCSDFKPAVDRLIKEYGNKIRVVFKQKVFNAPSPDALLAAEASLAAKAQGKFWPYHDKLFAAGFSIDPMSLERYAKELGLNVARFKRDLKSGKFRKQVLRDSLLANEVGAHSFPNVLANGVRMKKPKNFDSLKRLVDGELARAKKLMAQGVKATEVYAKAISGGKNFPQLGPRYGLPATAGSAAMGPSSAKVTIAVYEDFECPFCAKYSPNLKIFQKRFPKSVKLVFKHLPLNIHPDAQLASEASLAANAQGKFWAYHDKLFANQKALKRPDLERYAQEIGLNMKKFKAALDARTYKAAVEKDMKEAQRMRVRSTPTVLLNGRRYQGPRGMDPMGLEAVSRVYLGL